MNQIMSHLLTLIDSRKLNASVIEWACPIPTFGNSKGGIVATLGLNPSNREFVDCAGNELRGLDRRFPTLESMGAASWGNVGTQGIAEIESSSRYYFQRKPYTQWFNRLESLMASSGWSYYFPFENAFHLDLVPFATYQKWGELPLQFRHELLRSSRDTVASILRDGSARLIVANGSSVIAALEVMVGRKLSGHRVGAWDLHRASGRDVPGIAYYDSFSRIGTVDLGREIIIAGFNHNIQSSFGITRAVLASISDWLQDVSTELKA